MVDHGNKRPTERTAERDGAAGIQQATSQASLRRDLMQRPSAGDKAEVSREQPGEGWGGRQGEGEGQVGVGQVSRGGAGKWGQTSSVLWAGKGVCILLWCNKKPERD